MVRSGGIDTPVDITGYDFRSQCRLTPAAATVLYSLTVGAGITIVDAALGKIELSLTSEQTEDLSFRQARWDLEAVYPNGDVARIVMGAVTLSEEVTR